MTILITGGAGFIGSHLAGKLLCQGKDVVVLDSFDDYYDPEVKRKNIEPYKSMKNFRIIQGNILNRFLVKELLHDEKPEKVIHLAAKVGVRSSIREPLIYEEVNVKGTLQLLQLCVESGVKQFIFGSSSSVYGIGSRIPFNEAQVLGTPASPYASSKISAEKFCQTYSHLYKLGVVVLRFFTVYGPGQRPEMAIHKFTRLIDRGEEVPVFGDGSSRRDYTYVSDIVDGIVSSMERDFDYEVFNLGDSRTVELGKLISIMEEKLGKKARIKRLPEQPGDVPVTYADIGKARELLGFSPKVAIEEGIKKFVDWIRKGVS